MIFTTRVARSHAYPTGKEAVRALSGLLESGALPHYGQRTRISSKVRRRGSASVARCAGEDA